MLTQALLVDDSRSALDFLKRLIEADGMVQATAFSDPVQAMAAAREHEFDIVLVDYEMRKWTASPSSVNFVCFPSSPIFQS
jgi:putative two-component system response regulator